MKINNPTQLLSFSAGILSQSYHFDLAQIPSNYFPVELCQVFHVKNVRYLISQYQYQGVSGPHLNQNQFQS